MAALGRAQSAPPDSTGLPEGFGSSAAISESCHTITDDSAARYNSPCPPPGHGTHNDRFRLLALSVEPLDLPEDPWSKLRRLMSSANPC